jgi:hypothetical protein
MWYRKGEIFKNYFKPDIYDKLKDCQGPISVLSLNKHRGDGNKWKELNWGKALKKMYWKKQTNIRLVKYILILLLKL